MIQVTVKLFAGFRRERFTSRVLDCAPGVSAGRIADDLEIPVGELGIVLVNGRHAETDRPLQDGETLSLFPQIGGG
jgi:molybdopterin synthase sulfur carrier subunit